MQCCGFVGKQIPVCLGSLTVTEYGNLSFKSLNSAVHIRLVQRAATVANQITGGEVIASVYNDVIFGNQTAGILLIETERIGMYFYITVQSLQSLGGTVYLRLSYLVFRVQYLALQVADTDRVIVHQTYCTYPCTCKIEGGRGTKSACAYYQNSCLMQFFLSVFSYFGKRGLSAVSGHDENYKYKERDLNPFQVETGIPVFPYGFAA